MAKQANQLKTALDFTFCIVQGTGRDNPVEDKGPMESWPVFKDIILKGQESTQTSVAMNVCMRARWRLAEQPELNWKKEMLKRWRQEQASREAYKKQR